MAVNNDDAVKTTAVEAKTKTTAKGPQSGGALPP